MTGDRRDRLARWLFVLAIGTTFYVVGCGFMEGLVNYPSWREVGDAEWVAFRGSYDALMPVFVGPFFLSFPLKVALLWLRPAGVPRWGVAVLAALHLELIVVTVGLFLPRYQTALDTVHDRSAIDALIAADIPLREVPCFLMLVVATFLAVRALTPAAQPQGAAGG
jgi:hypothetical protein